MVSQILRNLHVRGAEPCSAPGIGRYQRGRPLAQSLPLRGSLPRRWSCSPLRCSPSASSSCVPSPPLYDVVRALRAMGRRRAWAGFPEGIIMPLTCTDVVSAPQSPTSE